jgi:hypothetical protein
MTDYPKFKPASRSTFNEQTEQIAPVRPRVPLVPGARPAPAHAAQPQDAYLHSGPIPGPDEYSWGTPVMGRPATTEASLQTLLSTPSAVPAKGGAMEVIGAAALIVYRVVLFIAAIALLYSLWQAHQMMAELGKAFSDISDQFNN